MLRGVLTGCSLKDANRVVIAELQERPKYAEIHLVSDESNDFAPILFPMGNFAAIFLKDGAVEHVKREYPKLPFSIVSISHTKMTQEEAYSIIMGKPVKLGGAENEKR